MPFFTPKDGQGIIRFKYCGFIAAPNGGYSQGYGSIIVKENNEKVIAKNKEDATAILSRKLRSGAFRDASGKPITPAAGYNFKSHEYVQSTRDPKIYYHDFVLKNDNEDHFCQHDGGNRKKSKKSRKTKKSKKSRKSRTRRMH